MSIYVNDDGTGKEPNMIYVNDDGTGKEVGGGSGSIELNLTIEGEPDGVRKNPEMNVDPTIDGVDISEEGYATDGQVGDSEESEKLGSSEDDTSNLTSITVDYDLSESTEYIFKARIQISDGNYSSLDSIAATTRDQFVDTSEIGVSTSGGYYGGTITYNSTDYVIIVSPKSEGESSEIEWSSDTDTEYGCTNDDDGKANTDCMLDNDTSLDSNTATKFIDDIQTNGINGYNDGYIPAIDELQMMYENMYKANKNETLSGTDWYDNGETFEFDVYWSSTEYSSGKAYRYYFNGGDVYDDAKDYTSYVRAVRRVEL